MKLRIIKDYFGQWERDFSLEDAIGEQFAPYNEEGELERLQARSRILQELLVRVLEAMTENSLLTDKQLSKILDGLFEVTVDGGPGITVRPGDRSK